MKKQEDSKITAYIIETLQTIANKGKVKLKFDNLVQYEAMQEFVQEGLLSKEDKIYSLTERGEIYLAECDKKLSMIAEDEERKRKTKLIEVKYKTINESTNRLEDVTVEVQLDPVDNYPIFIVEDTEYNGLINRSVGQHWRKFIGESGQKLVRERKLSKFYVESAKTHRRYMYIVPTKE